MNYSKAIYKMYDPEGQAIIFKSLTELRQCLDLTHMEIDRVAKARNVATLNSGEKVIIYRS